MMQVGSTPREMALAAAFVAGDVPFSFSGWQAFSPAGQDRYTDGDGLELTVAREQYADSAAVEWTLWLNNAGVGNSRQIRQLLPLDVCLEAGEVCRLSYAGGTRAQIDDFQFTEKEVTNKLRLDSVGSRSVTPFFNLDLGGRGVLIAVGWTKNWFLEVERLPGQVRLRAGMPETDFYLKPGERVRTPRILLLFWEGEKARSYNLLRRHLICHHVPKDERGEPYPPLCLNAWGSMKTENHLKLLSYVKEHQLAYDAYWIDAGWFGDDHDTVEFQRLDDDDWFFHQGNWRVNRRVHPGTLKPISDAAHSLGMKLLLWYDLYNCIEGIGWAKDHPEWGHLEGPMMQNSRHAAVMVSMLNINNPEARAWLVQTLTDSMQENGVDYYREDPPPIYGGEDEEGRVGVCEMKAVESLYAIWDALRERFPGLLIDNCGGGGSRVDLETVSRAYVLWRSDYNCHPAADPIGSQVGNMGLGRFVPLVACAPPTHPGDDYTFRSGLYGGMGFGLFHVCAFDEAPTYPAADYPVEWHRQKIQEYQDCKPYFSGDFWVLADCGAEDDVWAAYQMDRPDLGRGVILAFRRPNCKEERCTVRPVLAPGRYELTNRDTGEQTVLNTAAQQEFSLSLTLTADKPAASVMLTYRRVEG